MFREKSPREWTTQDVGEWLQSFDFGEYVESFQNEKITGDFLLKYVNDVEIMGELGITKKVRRKRLEFEIEKLMKPEKKPQETSSRVTRSSKRIRELESSDEDEEMEDESESLFEEEDDEEEIVRFQSPQSSSKRQKLSQKSQKSSSTSSKKKSTPKKKKIEEDQPVLQELPLFQFQLAASNRSKCRNCEEKIEKSDVKFGVISFFNRNGSLLPYHLWFHPLCGICIIPPPPLLLDEESDQSIEVKEIVRQCKFCSRIFPEEVIKEQSSNHTYFFKIGQKRKDLLCQYCAIHVLQTSDDNIRLSEEVVRQIDGFKDANKENQDSILQLFTSHS